MLTVISDEKTSIEDLSILLVDGSAASRNALRLIINPLGAASVKYAGDEVMALEAANTGAYDAILMDREFNEQSGLPLVIALRRSSNNKVQSMPIIMMAPSWEYPEIVAAQNAGVNEYISKPATQEEIEKCLNTILDNPRPFIKESTFTGPDRRRKASPNFDGGKNGNNGNEDGQLDRRQKIPGDMDLF
ncbi:MAG: response regulator [Rhodospirillales bacterium]|jgi:two-component system, chemotaxis family, chemotaxis protein CheY|nr:response regulator [Rhodospirillales bacterium]